MFRKKPVSDQFTLALSGMTTINSFVGPPVIPHDRLRKIANGESRRANERSSSSWLRKRFRAA